MDLETLRAYCLSKPWVEETLPFGPDALVFKVLGKVFAITDLNANVIKVNLKCDPDYALEIREVYDDIEAGFHMNKKHWNTVDLQGSLKASFIKELIDHSYDLVLAKVPGKKKPKG